MRCWDWFGDRSLVVIDIALACCALEVEAALLGASALVSQARGSGPAENGTPEIALSDLRADDAVAIVVSGTVTDTVLPIVRNILAQAPGAKVISFGACASAGGPYWDSYAVTKGIAQIVDVDLFVPGCPPTPQALEEALGTLRDARSAGSSAIGGVAAGSDASESRWLRSAEGASRSPIAEEPRWLRSAEGSDVGESRWLRSAEGASRSPVSPAEGAS